MNRLKGEAGHYHVDVFAGPKQTFVRGFTLVRQENGEWIVYDEVALTGRSEALSESMPLADALRMALAKLQAIVDKPVRPVWGSAPFGILGYRRPTFGEALRAVFLRTPVGETVGEDGSPMPR